MSIKYGFTGSRFGLSNNQTNQIVDLLKNKDIIVAHGDCVGADSVFHKICEKLNVKIIIHPPTDNKLRAFCKSEFIEKPLPYLKRNHNIVDFCDELIACPQSSQEVLRSGTWATIRYAKKSGKKVHIIV